MFLLFGNREQLQEILSCLFHENREICGFCEQCFTCARLNDFRQRLTNAYFFYARKDGKFKPQLWRFYFFAFWSKFHFRVEIDL